jgi:hypothetical protein
MPRFVRRVIRPLEGRFALAAIGGFCMFSATFALATAMSPSQVEHIPPASSSSPEVEEAEAGVRAAVDERLHLHLKRLQTLSQGA